MRGRVVKSRAIQQPEGKEGEENQCEPDSTSGKQRKGRVEKQSRAISLKARGEEERQCEPVGTWRKQVKRSLLLSTATRRGLARACLSSSPLAFRHPVLHPLPPPYPSGIQCFTLFLPPTLPAPHSSFSVPPSLQATSPTPHFLHFPPNPP